MWCRKVVSLVPLGSARNGVLTRAFANKTCNQKIGVIGAPFEKGQPNAGTSDGPSAIRKTGLIPRLVEFGLDVTDYGDLRDDQSIPYSSGPDGERDFQRVLRYSARLSEAVTEVRKDNGVCVVLGGDHSIAIGTVHGHKAALQPHQELTVLWVDAHADMNTGASSSSGNMHGMSLAFLLSQLETNAVNDKFPANCLLPENIVFIGLRDVEVSERNHIEQLGIRSFNMPDVDRLGIHEVMARTLDHLRPGPDRPLHLSFDIDALDPLLAPATGTPVAGGLTMREGLTIMEAAQEHIRVLDLVEINPSLSDSRGAQLTALNAKHLILNALTGFRGT